MTIFPSDLSLAQLQPRLTTHVIGREFVRLHHTTSTNDIVQAAATTGRAEGLVVLAEHQTHGRGQHGRQWSDVPHQSLLCSLLLRPQHIPATHTAYIINAFVAVLAQTIAHVTTASVHIKWPNDIVIMAGSQRRKLAGVLCEARIVAHHIDSICIGWGVNVNAHPQHHSDAVDLARYSSAVNEWTTQPISRADILITQLNAFDRVYQQLQHDPSAYQTHWRQLVPMTPTSVAPSLSSTTMAVLSLPLPMVVKWSIQASFNLINFCKKECGDTVNW
jgi:BirA family biotin operon repressor/biotin-[acetyl-CoA-carboxylase] ligase